MWLVLAKPFFFLAEWESEKMEEGEEEEVRRNTDAGGRRMYRVEQM